MRLHNYGCTTKVLNKKLILHTLICNGIVDESVDIYQTSNIVQHNEALNFENNLTDEKRKELERNTLNHEINDNNITVPGEQVVSDERVQLMEIYCKNLLHSLESWTDNGTDKNTNKIFSEKINRQLLVYLLKQALEDGVLLRMKFAPEDLQIQKRTAWRFVASTLEYIKDKFITVLKLLVFMCISQMAIVVILVIIEYYKSSGNNQNNSSSDAEE